MTAELCNCSGECDDDCACAWQSGAPALREFRAVAVMCGRAGLTGDVHIGEDFLLQVHTAMTPCRVTAISQRTDRRTGLVSEYNPSELKLGEFGVLVLSPLQPVWCELFSAYPALGRVSALQQEGAHNVCFVGVAKKVEVRVSRLTLAT